MASSDNLSSLVEPWAFRPFTDSWISDAFIRDTETLTKALQKSLSEESKTLTTDSNSALVQLLKSDPAPTPTSTMSGSDPETAPKQQQQQNRRNNTIGTAGGKISKRKSRASKRSQTTFITADPANFRQMVQQVTGIGFCNPHVPVDATVVAPPVLKPEPQRLGNRLQSCLPTLDTSALLLDHHPQQQQQQHHQQIVGPTQATLATGHVSFAPVADGGAGLEFDSFQSFPTLESWRVM